MGEIDVAAPNKMNCFWQLHTFGEDLIDTSNGISERFPRVMLEYCEIEGDEEILRMTNSRIILLVEISAEYFVGR